jgi:hypothetical protein
VELLQLHGGFFSEEVQANATLAGDPSTRLDLRALHHRFV